MVKPLPKKAKTVRYFSARLSHTSTPIEIQAYAKSKYFYYLHKTLSRKFVSHNSFNPQESFLGIFELFLFARV